MFPKTLLCLLTFIHKKKKTRRAVFCPPSVTPLSTILWSRAVMYPEGVQKHHDRDTLDLSQGHVTKNQPIAVRA